MDERHQTDFVNSNFAQLFSHLLHCESFAILLQKVMGHEFIDSAAVGLLSGIQFSHQVHVSPDPLCLLFAKLPPESTRSV